MFGVPPVQQHLTDKLPAELSGRDLPGVHDLVQKALRRRGRRVQQVLFGAVVVVHQGRAIAVEHPVRDEWWDDRSLLPLLDRVQVPVYLGCDWEDVPLHLPGSLRPVNALPNSPHVRVVLVGDHGISWPWESRHVEALAWYDHWLKGRDTGILDGPAIRYQLRKGEGYGWHTADTWPVRGAAHRELALRGDGTLGTSAGETGQRTYMTLGAGLNRARVSEADPPSSLSWETKPFAGDLDVLGNIELRLDATTSASDTAGIVTLQDVAPDGTATDVTAGFLRASLSAVDESASETGAPSVPCTSPALVPVNQPASYRIPVVGTGYRFAAGHRLRLVLASDDQDPDFPAMMPFRHASVGTSSLNRVAATSRLLLPHAAGKL
jgi:predicted acyl esterase